MADFLTNLFQSIFTPGPTPTLIIATNASFAALQILLLSLLIATYSIHFLILSFLSGGLWWAINWFVTELQAAKEKEEEAIRLREVRKHREEKGDEGAKETEMKSEDVVRAHDSPSQSQRSNELRVPPSTSKGLDGESDFRKRRSLGGDASGYISTDSEWDKVEKLESEEER